MSFIKDFMASLDTTTLSGTSALDQAVKASSHYDSLEKVIDNLIADCKSSGSSEYFLKEFCGIDITNKDTGAITGSDAGGSTVKSADDVVPESGDLQSFTGTSFSKNGLTVKVPSQSELDDNQKFIVNGLYTWWIEEGLKLIKDSYEYSFTDDDVKNQSIQFYVVFSNDSSSDAKIAETSRYTRDDGVIELTLNINTNYFKNLNQEANAKAPSTGYYLDRTIAHELTHAIMAVKVNRFYNLPVFVREGIAEITHGIDDEKKNFFQQYIDDYSTTESTNNFANWIKNNLDVSKKVMLSRMITL